MLLSCPMQLVRVIFGPKVGTVGGVLVISCSIAEIHFQAPLL